jgi:hypothetical protein
VSKDQDLLVRRLQAEYNLKVLTLSINRSSPEPQVVFELSTADPSQPSTAVLTAEVGEIGLPRGSLDYDIPETRFRLPEYLTAGIRGAVEETEPSMAPLWLRFSAPIGILPVAPWEKLLQPVLGVPILRLPYHAIMPPATTHSLNTVVCFSSPKAKHPLSPDAIAEQFLRQVPADLAPYTAFHLFADEEVQPLLQGIQKEFGNQYDIRVYESKEAPTAVSEQVPRSSSPGGRPLLNPWLIWMRDSLAGRSADLVHFLCHCYLSGEDGALALAESPVQNSATARASFVSAPELAEFLNQTGAWSVAFTSPPSNYSVVGMRMLQDQVARLRPGPCLLHDMVQPGAGEGLGQAYRFLYVRGWQPPPNSSSISLYCHPYREMERVQADLASESLLNEYTLAGRLGDLFRSPDTPAWISTSQRVLEQNVSRLAADPVSDQEVAESAGQKNALRFVADVLAKHARVAENAEGGTKESLK